MWYAIGGASVVIVGVLAFFLGKKLAREPKALTKTTTFLVKSIQAIAELAVLEYRTEGVTEIEEDQPNNRSLEKRTAQIHRQAESRLQSRPPRLLRRQFTDVDQNRPA